MALSIAAALAALLAGCASSGVATVSPDALVHSVRRVDFSKAPELEKLARHAQEFGDEIYPKICTVLSDKPLPAPAFQLIVRPLRSRNEGEAHLEARRIYINSDYLTNSAVQQEQFDKVFAHEMGHMALQRRHEGFLFWRGASRQNDLWEDALVDYARFKLLGPDGWACAECTIRQPHYTSGYVCGGAFLLFVDANSGSNVVRQFSGSLSGKGSADAFFTNATGKSMAELQAEFQKSPAFKPGAAEMLELERSLGFKDGRPPRDFEARFKTLVGQHPDPLVDHVFGSKNSDFGRSADIASRLALYFYLTQPGGTAELYVYGLAKKHVLPGFKEGEKGQLATQLKWEEVDAWKYPVTRTVVCRKNGDPSNYHYTVVRASRESEWRIEKAWRTAPDGKVVEEFALK